MPLAEERTCGDVEPTQPLGKDGDESLNYELESACLEALDEVLTYHWVEKAQIREGC